MLRNQCFCTTLQNWKHENSFHLNVVCCFADKHTSAFGGGPVENRLNPSYRTLAVPRTSTNLGDGSFAVAGPRVWNSLPATIRHITSYGQFRQRLKTDF